MPRKSSKQSLPRIPKSSGGGGLDGGVELEIDEILGEEVTVTAIGWAYSAQYSRDFLQLHIQRPESDDPEEIYKIHTGATVLVREFHTLEEKINAGEFELPAVITIFRPKGKKYLDFK